MKRFASMGLAVLAAAGWVAPGWAGTLDESPPPAEPDRHVLEWSVKLHYRGRYMMRKVGIDQWSEARILMHRTEDPRGRSVYSMIRPLEDPWVFRWYPTKAELKLGATIAVPAPEVVGDPYGELSRRLEPEAERLAKLWRDDPFWESCRERETVRPELSDPPTYPFYVLGATENRLRFRVEGTGAVDPSMGLERMSEPWLPSGWTDAKEGKAPQGIGYWDRKRPDWEPQGYPALFRSLAWFRGIDPETGGSSLDLADLARVVEILNPQVKGRLDWNGHVSWSGNDSGVRAMESEGLSVRVTRNRSGSGPSGRDEIQVSLEDAESECRLRLEVRLAYLPLDSSAASRSSRPMTKPRISSRTLR